METTLFSFETSFCLKLSDTFEPSPSSSSSSFMAAVQKHFHPFPKCPLFGFRQTNGRFGWQSFSVRKSFCRALFSYFSLHFQPPAINCSVCDLNSGVANKLQYIAVSWQKYRLQNRKMYFHNTVMKIMMLSLVKYEQHTFWTHSVLMIKGSSIKEGDMQMKIPLGATWEQPCRKKTFSLISFL